MSHGFLMVVAERLGIAESIDFICTNTMTLASVETDTYDLVYTSNGVSTKHMITRGHLKMRRV